MTITIPNRVDIDSLNKKSNFDRYLRNKISNAETLTYAEGEYLKRNYKDIYEID